MSGAIIHPSPLHLDIAHRDNFACSLPEWPVILVIWVRLQSVTVSSGSLHSLECLEDATVAMCIRAAAWLTYATECFSSVIHATSSVSTPLTVGVNIVVSRDVAAYCILLVGRWCSGLWKRWQSCGRYSHVCVTPCSISKFISDRELVSRKRQKRNADLQLLATLMDRLV
jgi:hypothetical protein